MRLVSRQEIHTVTSLTRTEEGRRSDYQHDDRHCSSAGVTPHRLFQSSLQTNTRRIPSVTFRFFYACICEVHGCPNSLGPNHLVLLQASKFKELNSVLTVSSNSANKRIDGTFVTAEHHTRNGCVCSSPSACVCQCTLDVSYRVIFLTFISISVRWRGTVRWYRQFRIAIPGFANALVTSLRTPQCLCTFLRACRNAISAYVFRRQNSQNQMEKFEFGEVSFKAFSDLQGKSQLNSIA